MTQPVEQTQPERKLSGGLKFVLEFGPLIAFFVVYKWSGIYVATMVIMATTVITLAITWLITRKLSIMPIVTLVLITIFGGLTLYLKDPVFIQVKVTIINGMFAAILLGGWLIKKPLLKFVFGEAMNLDPVGWLKLTLNWGLFFLALALANEVIRATVTMDTWVTYKTFGILPLTFIFAMSQLPLMQRHMIEEDEK
ncbi:Intracellular septation protein IspA [hydrothermal vent metagenome]|uniref:Intracellular septation protein IspA n=1 Tax=hydrothermal vent metagenome TaxID=652676 RepID=A0A3B0S367_9ZZZZ